MTDYSKIDQNEFQSLIGESIRQSVAKEKEKKIQRLIGILRIFLIPLLIAGIVIWATLHISKIVLKSAQMIAQNQINSAEVIAKGHIDHSDNIARSNREIQMLEQIKEIFNGIIEDTEGDKSPEMIKNRISSLEIYKDLAFPYLVNIRNYFKNRNTELSEHAKNSIHRILELSQPDFTHSEFKGDETNPTNMRHRSFVNYNLSNSRFEWINLYKANLQKSTLKDVVFHNCDLYGADFTGANLENSVFTGQDTNLRKAVFVNTNLDGVRFEKECKYLEDAIFSLKALLKANEPPFKNISRMVYIQLLVPHKDEIESIARKGEDGKFQLKLMCEKAEYDCAELLDKLKKMERL